MALDRNELCSGVCSICMVDHLGTPHYPTSRGRTRIIVETLNKPQGVRNEVSVKLEKFAVTLLNLFWAFPDCPQLQI